MATRPPLRGPRPAPGFAGLRAAIEAKYDSLHRFIDRLEKCLGELVEALARESVTIAEIAAVLGVVLLGIAVLIRLEAVMKGRHSEWTALQINE